MKLKNVLIVVNDIERAKTFYHELFGLDVIRDFGENVMLTEGLVLQERKSWETLIGREAVFGGCDAELYFEERNLDLFLDKLRAFAGKGETPVQFLNKEEECGSGKRVVRIFDPDGHVIEVGETVNG